MPDPVIFVHIPKTAGSTLQTIIRKQYGFDRLCAIRAMSGTKLNEKRGEVARAVRDDKATAISGHMVFGAHQFAGGSFQYVSMVREPVDRVISDYYYVRRTPTHDFYDPVVTEKYSLKDYVRSGITIYTNNVQTRMLAGVGTDVPVGECTEDMLRAARSNVEQYFPVIGLTREFDRSIILMRRQFGWSYPIYKSRNKTRTRPSREEISRETRDLIGKHNELDIRLYRYIERRFEDQIADDAALIDREVSWLRRFNAIYSPAVRAYVNVRKSINQVLGRSNW